jgi:hypothetical protein
MATQNLKDTIISDEINNKYSISDNTFFINNDIKRELVQTEIGDSKQSDIFLPQMKISKWDNETNLSFRLLDDAPDTPIITTENEKIVYDKQKIKIEFYNLPLQEELEEGGYEFNITLKEKPVSNVISLSLNTKNVNFYYQDELTQDEIDRGFERPDNIVGSYAVYHANPPLNRVGGKLYKTGKMGHIPKPKIIDSVGNWVWGELFIDPVAELLTVTIPQSFLDTATYPVHHAAGLTFGYTTIGSSIGGATLNYILAHSRYTPDSNGTADSISIYYTGVASGSKSTAGFYLAPTNYPTALVGGAAEITNTNNDWNVYTLSSESVSAGTYYRVSFQTGVADSKPKYDSLGGGSGFNDYFKFRAYTAGSMPNPFPSSALEESNLQWSSYITYTGAPIYPPPVPYDNPPFLSYHPTYKKVFINDESDAPGVDFTHLYDKNGMTKMTGNIQDICEVDGTIYAHAPDAFTLEDIEWKTNILNFGTSRMKYLHGIYINILDYSGTLNITVESRSDRSGIFATAVTGTLDKKTGYFNTGRISGREFRVTFKITDFYTLASSQTDVDFGGDNITFVYEILGGQRTARES